VEDETFDITKELKMKPEITRKTSVGEEEEETEDLHFRRHEADSIKGA
jgi:hypothetical protein